MPMRLSWRLAWWIPLLLLSLALWPNVAEAHERREVGAYTFVVGFNTEPAIQGEPNGAIITVTQGERAVEGLVNSLKVTVAAGGGTPKEFPLRAVFGQAGRYVADFIPTRPGIYVFTFTGAIEGQTINERFESGPGRFDEVKSAETIQFPEPVPPGNEIARVARAATDSAAEAQQAAAAARSLAMGGLVLGAIGTLLAIGSVWLMVKRSSM
jgi:hypothetical protein